METNKKNQPWDEGAFDGSLADRMQQIVLETGKHDAELARTLDVTRATVGNWRNGVTKDLKMHNLLALEDKLGYAMRWIISGEGPKKVIAARPWESASADAQPLADSFAAAMQCLINAAQQQVDLLQRIEQKLPEPQLHATTDNGRDEASIKNNDRALVQRFKE